MGRGRKKEKADGNDIKAEAGKAQSSIWMAFATHELSLGTS